MHQRHELRPFVRRFLAFKSRMALGAVLGLLAVLAVIGLLSLAGWFLTAAAVAGLTAAGAASFNFFIPSVGVRVFAFVRTLARYGERVYSHEATFHILETLRTWFFRRIEPLVPAVLSKHRSGDILNRMVEDVDTLDNLYLRVLSPTATAVIIAFAVGTLLWLLDPLMALAAAVMWALAGTIPFATAQLGKPLGIESARLSAALKSSTVAYLQGLSEIRVYDADGHHLEAIRKETRMLLAVQARMGNVKGISAALLSLLSGLSAALILYVGVAGCHAGRLDGAGLTLATLAVLASFDAVWPLPNAFLYLARTREAARRLLELTEADPPVAFPGTTPSAPEAFDLTLEDIRLAYNPTSQPALDGINLEIAAGERVAILGASGSGKSSLVHLMARFWDPDEGRIRIGGVNLNTLSEPDLRRWICVISQKAHIFNASVGDNLRIAGPDASDAELREAMAAAGLHDFLTDLPDGLNTWIGESGKRISGGQARRLAVARAFLRDAPIWILDEPTEGLDRISARMLTDEILRRTAGRTVLWITHRQVEAARMDRIVLLEEGRVIAQGAHHALKEKNQCYRDLIFEGVLS